MEDICQDVRIAVNTVDAVLYDVCFTQMYPGRATTSVLTPMEMLRLLARLQALKPLNQIRLVGYISLVRELSRQTADQTKLTAAPTPTPVMPAVMPVPVVPITDDQYKNKKIGDITQVIPVSEISRKMLADWLNDGHNALNIWTWANPESKLIPTPDDAKQRVSGEIITAYLFARQHMDLFNVAKRIHGYGIETWKRVGGGDLNILKWLIQDGCGLHPLALFNEAAVNGHVHILEYLGMTYGLEHACGVIVCGVRAGHLEVLKWALRNDLTSDQILVEASTHGHLSIIMWMKSAGLA